jgi:hypothetical protein
MTGTPGRRSSRSVAFGRAAAYGHWSYREAAKQCARTHMPAVTALGWSRSFVLERSETLMLTRSTDNTLTPRSSSAGRTSTVTNEQCFMDLIVALGQVCSLYFGFSCQFSFHRLLHTHISSGAGTVGPLATGIAALSHSTKIKQENLGRTIRLLSIHHHLSI